MSLFNIFDTAGTALNAQSLRLNTTSSNLANANSVSSSTGETYRARHPVFAPIMKQLGGDGSSVGVQVKGVVESQEPLRMEYNPEHPMANEEGYIFLPNVNVVEEMANMISASRSYQTNVEVMNSAKQMMMRTLSMGQ
ncbi:flagellar basal body rod protein FlgC [Thiohalophilus sp.]|uniref:flagellar basal body rod protein FlgC n=1 Tax=Thiohalophilus sp. TaxID=3028392 RepID=UPI002ACDAB89|nr:flagellar basal body rod protein FlgC [Thiohalophilus sp.]MDZ7802615.1 flagellar basal body rod protein FlgC [Thiohalophilus sp.]